MARPIFRTHPLRISKLKESFAMAATRPGLRQKFVEALVEMMNDTTVFADIGVMEAGADWVHLAEAKKKWDG